MHSFPSRIIHFFQLQNINYINTVYLYQYQMYCFLNWHFIALITKNSWSWPTVFPERSLLGENNCASNMMFLQHTVTVTCPYWYKMQPSEAAGVRGNTEKDAGTCAHAISFMQVEVLSILSPIFTQLTVLYSFMFTPPQQILPKLDNKCINYGRKFV